MTQQEQAVSVGTARFEDMVPTTGSSASAPNLDLVMDLPIPVSVRIGAVRKTISEVLSLQPGSVIDLERPAGEPVDLFVNDRLVARGEVVVVGDRYGFRVTEIVAPTDRR
ncbi:MAG: hypothetical protein RIS21_857 [Planctomycetota bacterium]|jgi:flagellar motor switch protein FliN/FliY